MEYVIIGIISALCAMVSESPDKVLVFLVGVCAISLVIACVHLEEIYQEIKKEQK